MPLPTPHFQVREDRLRSSMLVDVITGI